MLPSRAGVLIACCTNPPPRGSAVRDPVAQWAPLSRPHARAVTSSGLCWPRQCGGTCRTASLCTTTAPWSLSDPACERNPFHLSHEGHAHAPRSVLGSAPCPCFPWPTLCPRFDGPSPTPRINTITCTNIYTLICPYGTALGWDLIACACAAVRVKSHHHHNHYTHTPASVLVGHAIHKSNIKIHCCAAECWQGRIMWHGRRVQQFLVAGLSPGADRDELDTKPALLLPDLSIHCLILLGAFISESCCLLCALINQSLRVGTRWRGASPCQ